MRRTGWIAAALGAALWAVFSGPADAGGIFVTGHDPDYHAVQGPNSVGARRILQRAIGYLTDEMVAPRILLVTDLRNPGGDQSDSRLGLIAAGFAFDVADHGSGTPGVLDLHTVDFGNYDAVVVASDYGGWLRQDELDILNARRADVAAYLSSGGAFVVLNESGGREGPGVYPGTSHDRYGFLPVTLTAVADHVGSALVMPAGTAMGLTLADTTGNPAHSVFTRTGGLSVVDVDAQGRAISLVTRAVDTTAPVVRCRMARSQLWPPNHNLIDVGLSISVTDDTDPNPVVRVAVFSDEDDEEPTGDGRHSPDAKRSASGELRLRAERNGGRDGRVYLIIVTATDAAGNVGWACCTVVVPHDRSRRSIQSVEAQAAAAEQHCRTHGTAPPGYFVSGDGPRIGPKQ